MGFGKKQHTAYGTTSKYFTDDRDDEVSVAIRKATNKHLTRPDPALHQRVVQCINTGFSDITSSNVASVLVKRLRADNPHKQWLAIMLTQRVLRDCKDVLEPSKGELLQEIASIASRPIGTTVVNASAAQRAKQEAFLLLQEHGNEGTEAMAHVGGNVSLLVNSQNEAAPRFRPKGDGPGTPRTPRSQPPAQSWSDLKNLVQTEIHVATNQTEVLQDMLRNSQNGVGNFERSFFEELTAQMVSFRLTFEANVAKLASFETEEANRLMIAAIETVEKMNTALNQYHELITRKPTPAPQPLPEPLNLMDLVDALPEGPPVAPSKPAGPMDLLRELSAPAPEQTPPVLPPQPVANNNPFGNPSTHTSVPSSVVSFSAPTPHPSFSAASAASTLSAIHMQSTGGQGGMVGGAMGYPAKTAPGAIPAYGMGPVSAVNTSVPQSPMGGAGNPFASPTVPSAQVPASPLGMAPANSWTAANPVDQLPSGLNKTNEGTPRGPSMRDVKPIAGATASITLDRGKAPVANNDAFDDLLSMRR